MGKLYKILLVDDNKLLNVIHKKLLLKLNIATNIAAASNCKEALLHFQKPFQEYPDLVFVDVDMPVMNGYEFIQELKMHHNHVFTLTRFVLLYYPFNSRKEYALHDLNITGVYTKPLNEEIILSIHTHIYQ